MNNRWLVNDCLGTIGGSRTLWHDLRDHCGLTDQTGGYTPFGDLADAVERKARNSPPSLIVRNASYFRPLRIDCPTISIAQDVLSSDARTMQSKVMARSRVVVFNSEYTRERIGQPAGVEIEVIPIGTDFELFHPPTSCEADELQNTLGIRPDSVLFVGADSEVKSWRLLNDLIAATDMQFVVVTKDGARIDHPRVRNFGPVPQAKLRDIMAACAALVCTSMTETQHLAGIEAGACGLPVFATSVGIYRQLPDNGQWGGVCRSLTDFACNLESALDHQGSFTPRQEFLAAGLDRDTCLARWNALLARVESEE